jgi:hypothetical protein
METFTKGNANEIDTKRITISGKSLARTTIGKVATTYKKLSDSSKQGYLIAEAEALGVKSEDLKVVLEATTVKIPGVRDDKSAWRDKGHTLTNELCGIVNYLCAQSPKSPLALKVVDMHKHIKDYPVGSTKDVGPRDAMIVIRQRLEDGMLCALLGGWEGNGREQYKYRLDPVNKSDGFSNRGEPAPMYSPPIKTVKPTEPKTVKTAKAVKTPKLQSKLLSTNLL